MRARVVRFVSRLLDAVTYFVMGYTGEVVMIDAAVGSFLRAAYWEDRGYRVTHILLTHGHHDHVCDVGRVRSLTGAPLIMGADDIPLLTISKEICIDYGFDWQDVEADIGLRGDSEFEAATLRIIALHTPGHSPGSYCYYFPSLGAVFTGDTLLRGSVGRWDLLGSDREALARSLRKLVDSLPPETVVFPGHGDPTTIGRELRENKQLRELIGAESRA